MIFGSVVAPNTHENMTGQPQISKEHECLFPSNSSADRSMQHTECNDAPMPHDDLQLDAFSVHSMTNVDLLQRIISFNKEQKKLFTGITIHFESGTNEVLKMFISGG